MHRLLLREGYLYELKENSKTVTFTVFFEFVEIQILTLDSM